MPPISTALSGLSRSSSAKHCPSDAESDSARTIQGTTEGTLLHEMLHQYLFERGEDPAHMGDPWRREIMRLTKLITGKTVWAGPSKTVRRNGKTTRMNAPHPETKESSLPQAIIARWPHDELGINLGFLGQSDDN